jgi:hypothetical protein
MKYLNPEISRCVETCPNNLIPNEITRICETNCSNNTVLYQAKCVSSPKYCDVID